MTFYAVGSLLFVFGLLAALAVIAANLVHYRGKMMKALRALSLDGIYPPSSLGPALRAPMPAADAITLRPAPRLAA